jgi:hypothetical protein
MSVGNASRSPGGAPGRAVVPPTADPTAAVTSVVWWRSAAALAAYALTVVLALAVAFVQIERGSGKPLMVLLFATFDLILVAALAAILLSITRRCLASVFGASAVVFLLYFASWLKMQYTAMAAQAGDLFLLASAWELAAPFARPVVGTAVAVAAVFLALWWWERPLLRGLRMRGAAALLGCLLFVACAWVDNWLPRNDPSLISAGAGPKIALFYRSVYQWPELQPASFPALGEYCCMRMHEPAGIEFRGKVKPNLVVVLQESTFPPSHLRGYEPVHNFLFEGAAPLKVHVRGSGTWVEEYAVLHGVPPTVYGEQYIQINRLGPAMKLPGRIAPLLTGHGYRTTTVYPVSGPMLSGETLHHSLGMQRFLGCHEIERCHRGADWNETPDSVMFDKALELLRDGDEPQFLFIPTMRQHSPHFSQFPLKEHKREVMREYGRRLALSGQEAQAFVASLRQLSRPTIVLMFGDHVPSDVMAAFDESDFAVDSFQTFFNVYDIAGAPRAAQLMARFPEVKAVDSAFLDVLLLEFAGFTGDYIDTKLQFMRMCHGRFCGQTEGSAEKVAAKR